MPFLIHAEAAKGLLTMEAAIEAVAAGFREWARVPSSTRRAARITTPDGVRVSVHPGGVPSVGGIGVLAHAEHVAISKEVQTYHNQGGPATVLFDVKDASLMGIVVGRIGIAEIEAEKPTPMRTAATSAVGTRCMAREDAKTLGILGAGSEAKYHLLAFSKVRRLETVKVFCRTEKTRHEFCRMMEKLIPCTVKPVGSAQAAVAESDIVLTATNSNVPVFDGAWLAPGTHVTSIMGGNVGLVKAGVAAAKRRELDDTTITRSDVIIVNSLEQSDPGRAGRSLRSRASRHFDLG